MDTKTLNIVLAALAVGAVGYVLFARGKFYPTITTSNWNKYANSPNPPGSWTSFGGGYGGDNVMGLGWE